MLSHFLWEIEIPAIALLWPHPGAFLRSYLLPIKKWRLDIEKYYELVKYRTKRVITLCDLVNFVIYYR